MCCDSDGVFRAWLMFTVCTLHGGSRFLQLHLQGAFLALQFMSRICMALLTVFLFLAPGRMADLPLAGWITITDVLVLGTCFILAFTVRPRVGWKLPLVFGAIVAAVSVLSGIQLGALARISFGLVDFALPVMIGVFLAAVVSRVCSHESVFWCLTVVGGIIACQSVLTAVIPPNLLARLGLEVFWSYGSTRGFSTFGGPNLTSGILAMLLPFSLSLSLRDNGVGVNAARMFGALILAGLLATLTRGAWLAALVGVLVFVIAYPGTLRLARRFLILGVMIIPGAALVMSPLMVHVPSAAVAASASTGTYETGETASPGTESNSGEAPAPEPENEPVSPPDGPSGLSVSPGVTRLVGTNVSDTSVSDRLTRIRLALDLIRSRPWLGYGPNVAMNDSHHYIEYSGEQIYHVHNTYLQLAVNLGVPLAVVAIGYVAVLTLKGTYVGIRQLVPHAVVLSTSLIVAATHALTDYFLWYPRYSLLFWFLVGYLSQQALRQVVGQPAKAS